MSKKSEMAAMQYLANKKPRQYKIEKCINKSRGRFHILLHEWLIVGPECGKAWLEIHRVIL